MGGAVRSQLARLTAALRAGRMESLSGSGPDSLFAAIRPCVWDWAELHASRPGRVGLVAAGPAKQVDSSQDLQVEDE
jgi:hypothetical protein